MRQPKDPVQDQAHSCLQEWAAQCEQVLGAGYPSTEVAASIGETGKRVQGGERPMSRPEAYAQRWPRWHRYNEAVRRIPPHLRPCIVRQYYLLMGEQRCADMETMSLTEWRKRRDTARAYFHATYQMLRSLSEESTTHCESA